jgi:MYXO-CTERM domain-containing protein
MSMWIALCLSPSWAFAPVATEGVSLEPQRLLYQHPEQQGRLLSSPAWRQFTRTDGAGWNARFDEATGTPRWMWGRGIPMPTGSSAELTHRLSSLLESHAALLGFRPGELALARANYVERLDTWYVELDTLRDGLPTYRGGISARVKHGQLIYLRVATAPRAPVTGALVLDAAAAVELAISRGPAPQAHHTEREARPMLLERRTEAGLELRTTWMVRTRTGRTSPGDPPGIWVTFVDAETGELLNVHNEVRFASGTIEAEHHERTLDGSALVTSPVPYAYVGNATDVATTDELGAYTVNGDGPFATELNGEYLYVNNDDGGEGYLSGDDPDLTWDSGDATQAEIDSYVFLHQAKVWGEQIAPEVDWVAGPVESNVNVDSYCNAYFDGYSVNFFDAGYGCNNTGQIGDVNYHEWGHGFHAYSLQAGFFDGSLSEGAGDTVSALITHDRYIAPYFQTNGNAIRDVGPDQVYPQDFVNSYYYVHYNGLIFGGAMYDLHNLLKDEEGEEQGTQSASEIFAGLLKGGPEIPDSYYEALVADDNDGDLSNGTPHICQIQDAFGRHGLGEAAGSGEGGVLVTHEPLSSMPAGADFPVSVELVSLGAGCTAVGADSATVHYRVDGDSWLTAPLSSAGTAIEGVIPEQDEFSIVEYYITGESEDGAPFSAPLGERINPFTFYVGDTIEVRCDDFEDDDGNYRHELLSGEEEDGADDWQWGSPSGTSGDPSAAWSGSRVWGNDLGFDGYNGQYKPGKGNRLESPRIDTAHYEGVFLSYQRWLQIEDGTFDQALITADDEVVWSNWVGDEDEHHLDGQWVTHVVDLDGIADQTQLRIGFELHSDAGLEFGGWTLDDICLLAPATPDNRLGITDFVVDAQDSVHATLSWTNPGHRPLEEIRVVRRTDRFPEAWDDGDVAWQDEDPELGEEVEVEDENGYAGVTYYAVFASDGEDWLSWVVEGWNADSAELEGGEVDDPWWIEDGPGEEEGGKGIINGCGCSGTGTAPGTPWLLLALLAGARGRRPQRPWYTPRVGGIQ